MTLADILWRLKLEAPTGLTEVEEMYIRAIGQRIIKGTHLGTLLMEEGLTPDVLMGLEVDQELIEQAIRLLRERQN